jgi:trimeric autotransporter adhesin
MTTYLYSSLADGQLIAFDPATDVLSFDNQAVSAADFTLSVDPVNGLVTFSSTLWAGFTLAGVTLTALDEGNLVFADGSTLAHAHEGNLYTTQLAGTVNDDLLVGSAAGTTLQIAGTHADGHQTDGFGNSPSVSADGRYVVFESNADLLGNGGSGGVSQVYMRDLATNEVSLVSSAANGTPASLGASNGVVAGNGRYVLFVSDSPDLVAGDTNAGQDLFLKDLQTGGITRVNTSSTGGQSALDPYTAFDASISSDGRFVVFSSGANNLVAGDTNGVSDIFLKDTQSGLLTRVSTSTAGNQANGGSLAAQISADGRFVVFTSAATNLNGQDGDGYIDVYVKNLQTGELTCVSHDAAGQSRPYDSLSPSISADGRYVAFESASTLLNDGQDGWGSVYVRDLETGTLSRVTGSSGQADLQTISISADGRYVVFASQASLTAADTNSHQDIYVKDTQTGLVALVSQAADGAASSDWNVMARISQDGSTIVFRGDGDNLVGGDGNQTADVFVVGNPLLSRTLTGGRGNDVYLIDNASDKVVELASQGLDKVISSVTITLATNVEQLVLTGSAAIDGTGNALNNRITGNGNANTLSGGVGADTLIGGLGDDTYLVDASDVVTESSAQGGNDTVRTSVSHVLATNVENLVLLGSGAIDGTGNASDNRITGTVGNNVLAGGAGVDTVSYANATSGVTVDLSLQAAQGTGGAGVDTLSGFENVIGSAHADRLTGSAGNNRLDGGAGVDTLTGGAGDDVYVIGHSGDQAIEGSNAGRDRIESSVSWTLAEHMEDLTLTGGARNATGNAASNALVGNAETNLLDGLGGVDTMSGGGGNDTYIVDHVSDQVVEAADGGTDLVKSSASFGLSANVEDLTLTGMARWAGGNSLANRLTGNDAANELDGRGGADTMTGGAGNDLYIIDNSGDQVVERSGGGQDRVESSVSWTLGTEVEELVLTGSARNGTGNSAANFLMGNDYDNRLDGGLGADTMNGSLGNDIYVVNHSGDVAAEWGADGIDLVESSVSYTLTGEVENLTLTGTAHSGIGTTGRNRITGNASNNLLDDGGSDPGWGPDTLVGGAGDDVYILRGGDSITVITETAGNGLDTVRTEAWTTTLGSQVENLELIGGGAQHGIGNAGANRISTTNTGDDTLDGGGGADTLSGGAGDDLYIVGHSGDVVVEMAAQGRADTVQASLSWTLGQNIEHLTLTGSGHNTGRGNSADNTIVGNAGNNLIDGGGGADTMSGGLGNDTFLVDNTADIAFDSANGGIDLVKASVSYTLSGQIEDLVLTGTAQAGTGNGLANHLTGNASANILDGGAGADTMSGGAGGDTYVVDDANDLLIEAANGGSDEVQASVSWTLSAEFENLTLTTWGLTGTGNAKNNVLTGSRLDDTLDGGAGADTMRGGDGSDTYIVESADDVVIEDNPWGTSNDHVLSSVDHVLGDGLEQLTLTGSALNGTGNEGTNHITGTGAANTLNDGGGGGDTLEGGAGNDFYTFSRGGGTVVEHADGGVDIVETAYYNGVALVDDNVEILRLVSDQAQCGMGNAANNRIESTVADVGGYWDTLNGGEGADTLVGSDGWNTFVVDNAGDVLIDNGGHDLVESSIDWTLTAGFEYLFLTGSGNTRGTGHSGDEYIKGNWGNNVISGGVGGQDTLDGWVGSDLFVISDVAGDTVRDMELGEKIKVDQAHVSIGNGDNIVDGAVTIDGPGGFSRDAEFVMLSGDVLVEGRTLEEAAAAAFGNADAAYATGTTRMFGMSYNHGVATVLFHFESLDGDAVVDADELTVLVQMDTYTDFTAADLIFGI